MTNNVSIQRGSYSLTLGYVFLHFIDIQTLNRVKKGNKIWVILYELYYNLWFIFCTMKTVLAVWASLNQSAPEKNEEVGVVNSFAEALFFRNFLKISKIYVQT